MSRITRNDAVFMFAHKHLFGKAQLKSMEKHTPDLVFYAILFQLENFALLDWNDLHCVEVSIDEYQRTIPCKTYTITLPFIGKSDLSIWSNQLTVKSQTKPFVVQADLYLSNEDWEDSTPYARYTDNNHAAEALAELCLQYHQHNQATSIL